MIDTESLLRSELARLFPAPVAQPDWQSVLRGAGITARRPRRRLAASLRNRSRLLILAVALAVLTIGGVAVAGTRGWGPLARIGSADRPATPSDTLSPPAVAQLHSDEPPAGNPTDQIGKRVIGQARLVATLPSGRKVYVVPTNKNKLCVLVVSQAESCGDALTRQTPITFTVEEPGPGVAPLAYGVAMDGVASVSFTVNGLPVTLPVHNNFFAYEGTGNQVLSGRASFSQPLVTFTDGSTELAH